MAALSAAAETKTSKKMKPQEKHEKLLGMTQFVQRIPSQRTTAEEADKMHLSIAKFGPETTYEGSQSQTPRSTTRHHQALPNTTKHRC